MIDFRAGFVVAFLLVINSCGLHAQAQSEVRDSLSASIDLGTVLSNKEDFLPHYLVHNQFGEVNENQELFVAGRLKYRHHFGNWKFTTGGSFRNDLFSSYYAKLARKRIFLSIGREKQVIGGLENSLSSGSMAVSQNARPIPMITVGTSEYLRVPFTSGYFKTKGHLSHGWFEKDRYISNALLHSKSFYLMLDLSKEIGWTASSGVVHFAQYGGTSPQGVKQPSSFSDFLKVFTGAGIPNPDNTTEGESNGLGNHLGIVETTVTQKIGDHLITINYQKPFEDEGGLQYVSLTDYLFGIAWDRPDNDKLVNRIYVEYIQTKWQGGPGLPDPGGPVQTVEDNFGFPFGGRDDTYNNWLYRSGWTHNGFVIGNPLFLTYERTLNFFETYPDYSVSIANNRLKAVHLGLEGKLSDRVSYKGLFTYSSNFGTYAGFYEGRFNWSGARTNPDFDYVFLPAQNQFYSMIELKTDKLFGDKPIDLIVKLAVDTGDLYNAVGVQASLSYRLSKY